MNATVATSRDATKRAAAESYIAKQKPQGKSQPGDLSAIYVGPYFSTDLMVAWLAVCAISCVHQKEPNLSSQLSSTHIAS